MLYIETEENDNTFIYYDRILQETNKAILLEIEKRKIWIPLSLCLKEEHAIKRILIPTSLATEKELV